MLLHERGRIAAINSIRFQIFRRHGTGGQNRVRADGDARPDPAARAEPRAVFERDGLGDEVKSDTLVIMAAGAEKRALRNADMAADGDAFEVQQPAFLAEPDVVADRELPWKRDFHLRLDGDIFANPRAKRAQDETFQRGKTERTQSKQNLADNNPKRFLQHARAAVKLARRIARQIHRRLAAAGLG